MFLRKSSREFLEWAETMLGQRSESAEFSGHAHEEAELTRPTHL